jgi:SHS2 domain-containing protein
MKTSGGPPERAPFEILEHPADVGFLARGANLRQLFVNSAQATASLACDLETIRDAESRKIAVTGEDMESLLYAWLAEIVAIADGEHFVFCRFEIQDLGDRSVRGIGYGEPFDRTRHCARVAIKAVTYHQFAVTRIPEGFEARVFLDL